MAIDLDTLRDLLLRALPIAERLADITPSQWDNMAVKVLRAVLENDTLLELLRFIIGREDVVVSAGSSRNAAISVAVDDVATPEVEAAAEKAGIGWATLLTYLPLIVRLVLTCCGKRG